MIARDTSRELMDDWVRTHLNVVACISNANDSIPLAVPGSRAAGGDGVVGSEPLPLAVPGSRAADGEGTAPTWPLVTCNNSDMVDVVSFSMNQGHRSIRHQGGHDLCPQGDYTGIRSNSPPAKCLCLPAPDQEVVHRGP